MAKSEHRASDYDNGHSTEDDDFDLEAFLEKDFAALPPPQTISGPWVLKVISTYVDHGIDAAKRPWAAIDLNLDPQYPVGDDAKDVVSELNMKDLPQIRQRIFVSTLAQERDFVDKVVSAFGVAPGKMREMRNELRGAVAIGTVKSVMRKGRPELRASYFRVLPDETPPI